MNARKLKGKTIAKVHQEYVHRSPSRAGVWIVAAVEFTDGTFLRFVTAELESDYGVEFIYPARGLDSPAAAV